MTQQALGASAPDDLIVVLNPHNLDFAEFLGPRAMLEAEGIIPPGTNWPQGYDDLRWQAGRFNYWLSRRRPPGAKGPRKQFADCDWFLLRQQLTQEEDRRDDEAMARFRVAMGLPPRESA